ncbi:serine/threonine protein kinase [Frankia sp. CNm7]|uniref:Serine/threonine protein kinase n=1 Tax=Frankia nepalensis TaxID=1836974 RepID=A0A937RNZ4_9ACTN|nr:serine/threonine-protein kinase [Frankia nepalensis]MBL7499513.1 serine/threonine protein kinase [Frankia nepalensis]MBL7515502.1 serine/threonine protein kinase [Frankia nepalensis]MBL7523293.1 serine/threonine protein kinase [Frankia nepalensis]MBL7632284.1 serine/threonine protein kinase [Frankia nepalensis]
MFTASETPSVLGQVGPYQLERRLGAGGMGAVYLGRGPGGEQVAVKVIRPDLARHPQFRARFRREADAARRVQPFCTAAVVAADTEGPVPFIASEFVDGPSLHERIRRGGPLGPTDLHRLAVATATALAAIHAAGVVHRDLKPANVMLSPLGPRVIDFGIAVARDETAALTQHSGIIGTPAYMSPEQASGGAVGPASDIFAWAGLILAAATGRQPFGGPDTPVPLIIELILTETPALTGLDEPLRGLVERAFARDPAERPTAEELLLRLVGARPDGVAPVARPGPGNELDQDVSAMLATLAHARRGRGRRGTGRSLPRRRATRGQVALVTVIVAVLALAAVAVPLGLRADATADAALAEDLRETSRRIAAAAPRIASEDPAAAARIALAAVRAAPTPQARVALASLTGRALPKEKNYLWSAEPSPDGRLVATTSPNKTVRLWDVTASPPALLATAAHDASSYGVAFSPDGTVLATTGQDRVTRLWDVADRLAPLATMDGKDADSVMDVAFAPDGNRLATAGTDGTVHIWDVSDRRHPVPADVLSEHSDSVTAVRFSPDGQLLVTASKDDTVALWTLAPDTAPARVAIITGGGGIEGVAFSPDGRLLAVAANTDEATDEGADEVTLFDVEDPASPRRAGVAAVPADPGAEEFSAYYQTVAFSPDGLILAAGHATGEIVLWSVEDPARPAPLDRLPSDGVRQDVAFSADGGLLVTTANLLARLWTLDADAAAALVCADGQAPGLADRWARLLPDVPFADPCVT